MVKSLGQLFTKSAIKVLPLFLHIGKIRYKQLTDLVQGVPARPLPCPSPLIGFEEQDWSIPIQSSVINLVDKITT